LASSGSTSGDSASGGSISGGSASGDIFLSPGVAAWRRDSKAVGLRKRIRSEICGNALGGTRLDTFVCDGLLPLLAARNVADDAAPDAASGMTLDAVLGAALGTAWRNWFVGDMPAHFTKQLRALGVTGTRATPAHNGAMQGLLGFLLEEEM
jgi:hypothetical protein